MRRSHFTAKEDTVAACLLFDQLLQKIQLYAPDTASTGICGATNWIFSVSVNAGYFPVPAPVPCFIIRSLAACSSSSW